MGPSGGLRPRGEAVNSPPCHGGDRGFESRRGRSGEWPIGVPGRAYRTFNPVVRVRIPHGLRRHGRRACDAHAAVTPVMRRYRGGGSRRTRSGRPMTHPGGCLAPPPFLRGQASKAHAADSYSAIGWFDSNAHDARAQPCSPQPQRTDSPRRAARRAGAWRPAARMVPMVRAGSREPGAPTRGRAGN